MNTQVVIATARASAVVVFSLLAACATQGVKTIGPLEVVVSLGFEQCSAAIGFDCIQVAIRNVGGRTVNVPSSDSLGVVMVPPNYAWLEYLDDSGNWSQQVFELATYDAPKQFVRVGRGETSSVVLQAFRPQRNQFDPTVFTHYRVVLMDWADERHESKPYPL